MRTLGGRAREVLPMSCRNLSAEGVGLVSSRLIDVGVQVSVTLRSISRGAVDIRGRVVRCEPAGDHRFDVALALDAPIDVREFAPADPLSNQTIREAVDPESLSGRVLIVSATPGDRAALARALRPTRMVVTGVASVGTSPDAAAADFALMTCNQGDEEPGSVLLDLYEHAFTGKALLIAPDRSARTRRMVDKLPLAGVLVAPVEDVTLLRILADLSPEDARRRLRGAA